jgi:hypothetical protein
MLISEINYEQENELEKNLVWILASPRSGTTWLSKKLISYHTHTIDEFNITPHLGISAELMDNKITMMKFRGKLSDYVFSEKYRDIWSYFLRKLVLNRIYAQFKETSKKIVIKEPSSSGFQEVSQIFPHSRIIILIRDGRDVVDSQVDARTYGFEKGGRFEGRLAPKLTEKTRFNFIKNRSESWVRLTEELLEIYEKQNKNQIYLVKYEDLLKNTMLELKKIYQFLDIKISEQKLNEIINKSKFENIPPEIRGKGKFFRIASPGKWMENFNENEKDSMSSIMSDVLKKLEYI